MKIEAAQFVWDELGCAMAETGAWWIDEWARSRVGKNSAERQQFDHKYHTNPAYERRRAMYVWRTFIASQSEYSRAIAA